MNLVGGNLSTVYINCPSASSEKKRRKLLGVLVGKFHADSVGELNFRKGKSQLICIQIWFRQNGMRQLEHGFNLLILAKSHVHRKQAS